jgi:predicted metal-dependent phosphoesterase TrpH
LKNKFSTNIKIGTSEPGTMGVSVIRKMNACYDLHTHSLASDGAYKPAELVRHAAQAGITALALSDHDTTSGIAEANAAAQQIGIRLIPAVEISTSWQSKSIHIVGINIDIDTPSLQDGLRKLQSTRDARAREMGARLAKHGFSECYAEATALAGSGMITRTHFARYLCNIGEAGSINEVFEHYLTQGKPGYVPTQWADLGDAIAWIRTAGGVATLAHPHRYRLTASWLRRLLADFKNAGGEAMEIVSGNTPQQDIQSAASLARKFELLASAGSDFHDPDQRWLKLGRLPSLPADLTPVWSRWHE